MNEIRTKALSIAATFQVSLAADLLTIAKTIESYVSETSSPYETNIRDQALELGFVLNIKHDVAAFLKEVRKIEDYLLDREPITDVTAAPIAAPLAAPVAAVPTVAANV